MTGPLDKDLVKRRERDQQRRLRSLPDGRGNDRPLPGNADIPFRSVAFFVIVVLIVWGVASIAPGPGLMVPWVIAYVVLPAIASWWLTHLTAPPAPPPGLDYDRIAQLEHDDNDDDLQPPEASP